MQCQVSAICDWQTESRHGRLLRGCCCLRQSMMALLSATDDVGPAISI